MDELVAFMRAQLDEDERSIRRLWGRTGGITVERYYRTPFDPSRALAEVDAKRQIIEEHTDSDGAICPTCTEQDTYRTPQAEPCRTLRLLALPYAGHPSCQEEWRP